MKARSVLCPVSFIIWSDGMPIIFYDLVIDKITRISNFTFRSSLSNMQERGVKFETTKSIDRINN